MKRDGALESIWQATAPEYSYSKLEDDNEVIYDVIIVGGGITGLSTAYNLQKAGKKCLVADAYNIGFGTTSGTTAHLNTFFDASFDQVIKDFGIENAKLFANCGPDAISKIQKNIKECNIECDFKSLSGYIFSLDEEQDKTLENIVNGTAEVGLPIEFVSKNPYPIPFVRVAEIKDQGQFHVTKYIIGLANEFKKLGGIIAEHCRITEIKDGEVLSVVGGGKKFKCRNVVYATHIPPGVNILHFRNAPYRTYVIAVKLKDGNYPQSLGYDLCEPYHYYRSTEIDNQTYLLIGGEDHKTGYETNTDNFFRKLESYARKYFDIEEVTYKWSSQYFESVDGLPYIGHLPGNPENVYVATGYTGNGMIFGTISSIVLSDLILTGENKYKNLFSPSRVKPVAGFEKFVTNAADVVSSFIGDKISINKIKELSEIANGEARVINYDGNTLAIYKDENGKLHTVNSACTHIKCTVAWNSAEKTWDCPCHGSRFNVDGEMFTAPARKDLEVIHLDKS